MATGWAARVGAGRRGVNGLQRFAGWSAPAPAWCNVGRRRRCAAVAAKAGGGRGGGGGAGDDDVGVKGAAARHCLPQTSRVVAATRLDLYSAFALWARATAGVRLEPQPYRNPIAEFGAAAEAVAPGSRPARASRSDVLLVASHLAGSLASTTARTCVRKRGRTGPRRLELPASACDDGAAAVAASPRPHTAAAAAVMASFNHPSGPWRE